MRITRNVVYNFSEIKYVIIITTLVLCLQQHRIMPLDTENIPEKGNIHELYRSF